MSFISYAQNGEDVILWRALGHVRDGFYIDIGACDPDDMSVTRAFYERGWSGINVEPSLEFHKRCVAARPRDTNLNLAVADRPGTVRFLNIPETGLSTTMPAVAEAAAAQGRAVEAREVRAVTLAEIGAMAGGREVHFLKIDVEGGEEAVLRGADFSRCRPWVVVVEATLPGTAIRSEQGWEPLLLGAGYDRCLFDGLNLYYLAREHAELAPRLTAAANVLDGHIPAVLAETRRLLDEAQVWGANLNAAVAERDRALAERDRLIVERDRLIAERERDLAVQRGRVARLLEMQRRSAQSLADAQARFAAEATQAEALRQELARQVAHAAALQAILSEAEARLAALRRSTSWRVTLPIRLARRLLSPGGAKEVARQVVHRGARVARRVPGMGHGTRLARGLAPGATEWLALRLRAYDAREAPPPPAPPPALALPPPPPAPAALPDLSEEEARLLRFIAPPPLANR